MGADTHTKSRGEEEERRQQDLNLRPQRGTDNEKFKSVAVTTWL